MNMHYLGPTDSKSGVLTAEPTVSERHRKDSVADPGEGAEGAMGPPGSVKEIIKRWPPKAATLIGSATEDFSNLQSYLTDSS